MGGYLPDPNIQSTTFGYDANGNVTTDAAKGMSAVYNLLNLPSNIKTGIGSMTNDYTAGGEKIKSIANKDTRHYLAGAHYLNGTFEFYSFGDGRIIKTEDQYQYQYQLNDHLGNTVVLFEDKSGDNTVTNDEVIQRYYYYPFGAETENTPWTQQPTPKIRYQYNGKEKIDELGLAWNDYGARNYDALLGRWMGVDALAEKYMGYSGYNYVLGNPIGLIDPDGRLVVNPYLEMMKSYQKKGMNAEANALAESANKVSAIIEELKTNDADLFNYVNGLTMKDEHGFESAVRVSIFLSSKDKGDDMGQRAETKFSINTGERKRISPTKILDDNSDSYGKINEKLSRNGGGLGATVIVYGVTNLESTRGRGSDLANEFGDVMFGVNYTQISFDDRGREYYNQAATGYSFSVQRAYDLKRENKLTLEGIYPLIYDGGKTFIKGHKEIKLR